MRGSLVVVALILILDALPASAGTGSKPDPTEAVNPVGLTYRHLRKTDVDSIFKICRDNDTLRFGEVQRRFFGDVYDASLSDLVVYMDGVETHPPAYRIHAALVRRGTAAKEMVLRGERKVWLLVLSDKSLTNIGDLVKKKPKDKDTKEPKSKNPTGAKALKTVAAKTDPPDSKGSDRKGKGDTDDKEDDSSEIPDGSIKIAWRFEPLAFAPSSGERTIRDVLGTLFEHFTASEGEKAEKGEVTKGVLIMEPRGRDSSGNDSLFAGVFGLDLQTNSINRVVFHPVGSGSVRSMHVNFSQFSASRLGGSLGLGYRLRTSGHQKQGDRIGAYLMGHYYIARPRLPVSTLCYGPIIGTNLIGGGIKDYLVLGARVTAFGQSGLWGGVNVLSGHVFQEGVVIGFDYRL